MMKEKKTFQPLTSKSICNIYNLLYKEGYISFPLTQDAKHKVESLVENVVGNSFNTPHYNTTEEKVVAYFYFIIKSHPFIDGNKRTATLVFLVLCAMNNLHKRFKDYDLDALAVFVEQLNHQDHQQAIKTLAETVFKED